MRNYKRKTNRANKPVELMQQAMNLVLHENKSLGEVSRMFEINKTSLSRFMKRIKDNPADVRFGYSTPRQVFNKEQESRITEYLHKLEQIFHGIGSKEVRRMAYDYAIKHKIKTPETWRANKMPSRDWVSVFLTRNPSLSIRKKPETVRIKAMSFNKTNVQEFYTKLAKILDQFKFTASAVWNADETSVSTVNKLSNIIAEKEKNNVTVLLAVSALGSFVPLMFIFPCEKFEYHFIRDGPSDCIGAGNSSGCLTHDEFFMYIQHFIKHVKASKESPVLLILNNNFSLSMSIPTLDLADENGVIMLSIPRHCSQKMQPLDVGVYEPFKTYMSSAKVAWMQNNAGKTMTIYDVPEIVRIALPLALEPNNIENGFEKNWRISLQPK
ncbi:uncharacterized protein LOC113386410 [Ctenocephalides felis]|uniref:uncharacterized protein LOC113386410 n=1 Tax=Ctenocephalides felis TaxID=7515 RepID=UPI000E6E1CFB|nr:uncharacterized protein LOC113386410 [Ctenocephalides felis]